jgi:hypothetical protein
MADPTVYVCVEQISYTVDNIAIKFHNFFRSPGLVLHYAWGPADRYYCGGPADCYYCILARSQLTSIVVHCSLL